MGLISIHLRTRRIAVARVHGAALATTVNIPNAVTHNTYVAYFYHYRIPRKASRWRRRLLWSRR